MSPGVGDQHAALSILAGPDYNLPGGLGRAVVAGYLEHAWSRYYVTDLGRARVEATKSAELQSGHGGI